MQVEMDNHIQRYERIITSQKNQIQRLHDQKKRLQQELEHVKQQRDQYSYIIQKDPLHQIFLGIDQFSHISPKNIIPSYQELENRIQIYRQRLEQSQKQRKTSQIKIQSLESHLKLKVRQIDNVKNSLNTIEHQLRRTRSQLSLNGQVYQKLNAKIKEKELNIEKLRNQNLEKQKELQQVKIQYRCKFQQHIQNVKELSIKWSQANQMIVMEEGSERNTQMIDRTIYNQVLDKLKRQQSVMEQMGRQLDQKNQQIAKYLSLQGINNGNESSLNQHFLKSVSYQRQIKEKMFRQLLQKFQEVSTLYNSSIEEKTNLEKQYKRLKTQIQSIKSFREQNKVLKEQYQKYKSHYEFYKKLNDQSNKNMIEVLRENQVFHKLMHQKYGQKDYLQQIQKIMKEYDDRMKVRQSKGEKGQAYYWTNISQLINMNNKLMDRVRNRR